MRVADLRALAVVVAALGVLAAGRSPASAAASPSPPAADSPAAVAAACASSDLALREVSATGGTVPSAVYALRNRGSAACRISGGVGIRLFDAQGKEIVLRMGARSAMPVLLTLAPGDEASFTVTYGRPGIAQCATSARIELYLAPQTAPVSAPASFIACAFPAARISNLQVGVPSTAPSARPSVSPATSRIEP